MPSLIHRVVVPELLDQLPPDDPQARRSRWDLQWIDRFLGNSRWIMRALMPWAESDTLELGAGEGRLLHYLHRRYPQMRLCGLDLVPRPQALPDPIGWEQGNFLFSENVPNAEVVVASLILHHLSDRELAELGRRLSSARVLVICEPWRHVLPLAQASLVVPLAGAVTRHDMPVSIRAGFRAGELAGLLALDPAGWRVSEKCLWRGSVRMLACRR